jgi:hypothetical protein
MDDDLASSTARRAVLKRGGYPCRGCDTDQNLIARLRRYPDILGTETMEDLGLNCPDLQRLPCVLRF